MANTQDTNYTGPAKPFVNSFWQTAKTTRELAEKGVSNSAFLIANMNKTIDIIKKKDPAYNTAAMIEEVKILKELLQSKLGTYEKEQHQIGAQKEKEQQEKKSQNASADLSIKKVNDLLTFLFDGNKDDHIPVEMKAKTEEILTLDRSGNSSQLKIWLGRLKKNADEALVRYPKLEKICREQTKLIEAQNYYRHFKSYQSYWDAAQKIFSDEVSFKNAYSLISNIINGLGAEDNLQMLIAKNAEQKMKDTRLPEAKIKDAALEKLFMNAYDQMYGASHKGKAIKAIVVSDDWQIQRNEVTGIVTGRLRKGAVVYKNAEGQCRLVEEFFIQQEYVGNSFIGTKSVYAVGKGQQMLCENVK
jgi:hypothetical protein